MKATGLSFGVAARDLTPDYPVWMHGYASRTRPSDGVCDPIGLQCLAVRSGDATVLLVAIDAIGIESWRCEELYDLLERKVGIGYPNILLACTHTHFAPALFAAPPVTPPAVGALPDPAPQFLAAFRHALVDAARESLRQLQPGRLQTLRTRVPQVQHNRRTVSQSDGSVTTNFLYPEDPSAWSFTPADDELTVLRVAGETGIRAVLANFGCHPVTGGADPQRDLYRISSDYPQYLRQAVASKLACPVLFTLGAAGDVVPLLRGADCRQRIGRSLGDAIVLGERAFRTDTSGVLRAASVTLWADTVVRVRPAAAEREYAAAAAQARRLEQAAGADRQSEAYRAALARFKRASMQRLQARLYPSGRHAIRLQFIQIGATILVVWPFEVLSGIALRIKQRFPQAVLVSCAGGYQGYLPLAEDHARGGYEVGEGTAHFVPGTGDRLLKATLQWLERNITSGRKAASRRTA